jgi:hypothetical protein
MTDSKKSHRFQDTSQSEEWPEKMKVSLARKFLGVSEGKMSSLLNGGIIPWEKDPIDSRVKLIKRSDLEALLNIRKQG